MTASPVATISIIQIEPAPERRMPAGPGFVRATCVSGEPARVAGPFDTLAPAFAAAVARRQGDLILVTTPDLVIPDAAWEAIEAAARDDPEAGAFILDLQGLTPSPAWRGRRCRSHERNLESLRFAQLIAPGALVVRREVMQAAAEGLPGDAGADWWRLLTRRIGAATRIATIAAAVTRRAPLAGEPACPSFAAPPRHRPRVLVLGQIEVSASLYFDFLESAGAEAAFRPLTRLAADAPHLAAADLVILVRELHRFWDEGAIELLRAVGTPFVYFTDDNFLTLHAERGAPAFYSPGRMRRALAGAAEVWTSTEALAAAHRALHPKVRVWGPVLDPALSQAAAPGAGPLTIALAGGDFRLPGLDGAPIAQLRAITERQALRLVVTEAAAKVLAPAVRQAEIVVMPPERSFRQFVRSWRRYAPDILLHPAGATANAPFKCPTAVIVAGYLGAAPVVADEPAYDGWSEAEGVLRLGPDAGGLALAAASARDPLWRAETARRLEAALAARFRADGREQTIDQVIAAARTSQRGSAQAVLASPGFSRRRAELGVAHATRWVRSLATS